MENVYFRVELPGKPVGVGDCFCFCFLFLGLFLRAAVMLGAHFSVAFSPRVHFSKFFATTVRGGGREKKTTPTGDICLAFSPKRAAERERVPESRRVSAQEPLWPQLTPSVIFLLISVLHLVADVSFSQTLFRLEVFLLHRHLLHHHPPLS